MTFYDILEKICNERGITPTKAARDIGVAQPVVSQWKKRGSTPKAETVQKLADYFGINPREFTAVDASTLDHIQHQQIELTYLLHRLSVGDVDEYTLRAVSRLSLKWSTNLSEQFYEHMTVLNDVGQQKVEEYAGDLAGNPEYCRQKSQQPSQSALDSTEGTDTTPPTDAPETPPEGE